MLHVTGTGFGRTGTCSMLGGLVHLGFAPCDHMLTGLAPRARDVLHRLFAGQSNPEIRVSLALFVVSIRRQKSVEVALLHKLRRPTNSCLWRRARVWR
jgi:hypothetical protein